jgi:hypothetical protein
MAINIIDGFFVGIDKPIDSRFVVEDISERNSIIHKYDGLKVFVKSERNYYIWNETIPDWEEETTGSTSGSGTINRIPRWSSSDTLGDSSLFNISNRIGLNTIDPKSILQINSITSGVQPLNLNVRQVSSSIDSAVIGYNWYFESNSDQRFVSDKISSFIEMTSTSSFRFRSRLTSSSDWNSLLDLNHNGWNFLRGATNGTFINGKVFAGSSTTPSALSNQDFTIGGSFRTQNSVYKNVKYVNQTTGTYTVLSSDNEIIFNRVDSGNFTVNLPTLNLNEVGRELKFTLRSSVNSTLTLSPAPEGLNNQTFNQSIGPGVIVTLISYDLNGTPTWKIIDLKGSGTLNQVTYWSGDNRLLGNSNFIFNGTNVGIGGVPTPTQRLHVNGSIRIQGNSVGIFGQDNSMQRMTIGTNTSATNSLSWIEMWGTDISNNGRLSIGGNNFRVFTNSSDSSTGSRKLLIDSNGDYEITSNLFRVDSNLDNNPSGLYREHSSSISVNSTTISQLVFQSGKMTFSDSRFSSIVVHWQRVGRIVSGNVRLVKNSTSETVTGHTIALPIVNTASPTSDGSCSPRQIINTSNVVVTSVSITVSSNSFLFITSTWQGSLSGNFSFSYKL